MENRPVPIQSNRIAAVQTPVIPVVGRWISETPGTISLGQGIVSYGPPREVIEAAHNFGAALADHRYGPVEGLPSLVAAIESKLAQENRIPSNGSRIVVTAGGNLAFMNAVLGVADPGDEFIFPTPFYFNHEMAVVMAGSVAVRVPTTSQYQLDLDAISRAINPRTRAVVTVSPNNPTGAVYPQTSLEALNALCERHGLFHIHDEAYEYFTYDDTPHFSPGSIPGAARHTISLFSLSKAYGMASWRVGYMVIPESLWDAINKIQDTLLICAPAISQEAAIAALRVGRSYATARLAELALVRRRFEDALVRTGEPFVASASTGAFYYFVRALTTLDSLTLTERLIREHRVAVIPGTAFGDVGCSIRVSYGALDRDSAVEGLHRLVCGLQALASA